MNPVEAHYDRNAEREWERLDRHRTEFAVTCRVLAEFMPPPPGRVLDIGGGPGRYALLLTRLGYRVTLLDISKRSLDLALEKATGLGIYLPPPIHGDATSLPDASLGLAKNFTDLYDVVLLMGPLYHLLTLEERTAAVREAWRVLRPGGIIFAAFITRFAPLRDIAIHSPVWIRDHPDRYLVLIESGLNPANDTSTFPDSYFAHPEEIVPFMASCDFEFLALQGCEGLIAGHEEAVNSLEGALWDSWVDLNYTMGREPTLRGASDHLLYAGYKPPTPLNED